jgi:hypothetical protein
MGGLILDVFVAYLYKSFIRVFEYVESSRWKRATASIVESSVLDPGIGGPLVKIRYQVDAEQNSWVTEEEIPFLALGDAERFARKFSESRDFYAAALANGGCCDGAPGLRLHYGPDFYAAYVRDLDGNKLAAVCRGFTKRQ